MGIFLFLFKNKWGIVASCLLLAFSVGIFRFNMVDVALPQILESHVGDKVILKGEIVDEPEIKENNQKLLLHTSVGREEANILLTVNIDQDYEYGDEVRVEGKLEKPENFTTDQGKTFDYVNYLRKDNILYTISFPEIEVISKDNGFFLQSWLFKFKDKFLKGMNLVIPNPENLLMGGLILGEKSSFNQSLRESFVNTGTIHIVALSGYNVTIVAEYFMKIFSFLPRAFATGVGVFSILLFILMTGASTTAIRAGIMATLALYARSSGRNYDVSRALMLAGVGMILFNPFILVYDVSFQLSFIATIAVIFLSPRLEKYFMWITKKFGLRDIITVTFSAYIFVLPFILYKMGNLSLVALPANILILPFIPFTMILGFITGFLAMIYYVFAIPVGYVSYLFLHYELSIISFFSNIPFASFTFPDFPLWLTILIYLYFVYRLFGGVIKKFFTDFS